ncbi:hypothetical protein BH11PLA2_BH11PLA2_00050 [soil metagenome]
MATLTAPPATTAKQTGEVQDHLNQAAGKIRVHDLTVGALLFGLCILAYLAVMVTLDKWLDLDGTVRKLAWCGFVGMLGYIGYRFLVRPLRASINPLYAAKRIEETVPDAKNGIINWVDLRDATMPESVRAAVTAKAAKQIANADVNRALESRTMLYTGSAVAALVVLLAILFLVFKPTVFMSLVGRTLNPFSKSTIATRTSLTITQPAGGDLTITAGQPVTISVTVDGRVPDVTRPDRLRVLLRHNPADANAEELPLEQTGGSEWSVRVPDYLIQNGFHYKVVGSDAETPEYKITVRPRPVFKAVTVQYEYPKYLNMKSETSNDLHIEAYRGTVVTITATANRELKDGRMAVAGVAAPVIGDVTGPAKDTMKVKFVLMENSSYKLYFTATNGETNIDSPPYQMKVISDAAPTVTFKPMQIDGMTIPLNGLMAVDADAADDFGLASLTLKLKIVGGVILHSKQYLGGKSLMRESDKTYPLTVDYKDSYKLGTVKDETGKAVELKTDMVLEYWLEATDNCTVPQPNVGKSKVYKVRLASPTTEPDQKQGEQKSEETRKNDEANHQKNQDVKNNTEPRPKKNGPQEQKKTPEEKQNSEQDPNKETPENKDNTQPQDPNKSNPENKDNTQPNKGSPEKKDPNKGAPANKDNSQPQDPNKGTPANKDNSQPQDPNKGTQENKNPMNGGNDPQPQTGSKEPTPEEKDIQKKAEQVKKAIDNLKKQKDQEAGQAKSGDDAQPDTKPEPKPMEKKEGKQEEPKNGDSKPEPGASSIGEPKKSEGSEAKNEGTAKPMDKSEAKSEDGKNGGQGAESKPMPPKDPMKNEGAGNEKPSSSEKTEGNPMNKEPGKEPGSAKGSPDKSEGDPAAKPESKPGAKKEPGDTKPANEKPAPGGEKGTDQKPKAGDAKPQQSAKAGSAKPEKDPKSDGTPQAKPDASPKAENKDYGAAENPMKKPGDNASTAKSEGTPEPKSGEPKNGEPKNGEPKAGPQNQKGTEKPTPDEKTRKEIENAAKDLAGNDEAKKQAARDKLDKMVGKENRENAEKEAAKMANDLKSDDKATRDAARKKLDEMVKKAQDESKKEPGNGDTTAQKPDPKDPKNHPGKGSDTAKKPDPKELENAAKDLAGNDEAKKQAAREKLDKMVGKEARENAENTMEDLNSNDPAKREAAEKKVKEMMDKMKNEAGKNEEAKGPLPEDVKKAQDLAKDLNSKDDTKRQIAEQELDKMLGKENRDKLQDQMKNNGQKPGEPLSDEAKKKVNELAKDPKSPMSKDPTSGGPPTGSNATAGKPLTPDEEFSRRSANLQLAEKLKKEKSNPELLKKLGWTQEDYDRFLKGYEEMLNKPETARVDPANPNSVKPPTVEKVNSGTAGKVETRVNGSTASPQAGGTAYAPSGFSDAQKKFAEAANKAKENDKK